MEVTFFRAPTQRSVGGRDVEWFVPTEHCRGPWDPDACHAGPPTGLLARAVERSVPGMRLARITVELSRPVPMAGFAVEAEVLHRGRTVATTRATLRDADGTVRVTAAGLHVRPGEQALAADVSDNSGFVPPRLADAVPGPFPIDSSAGHGRPSFSGPAVAMRYPIGQPAGPGSLTAWMRAAPLLPCEAPSPFQSICPLADCGNAFSRHAEPDAVAFVNLDLTVALHRDPGGDWLGSRTVSWWQPDGVGLSDAILFDDDGAVGRALQTLLLRRQEASSNPRSAAVSSGS